MTYDELRIAETRAFLLELSDVDLWELLALLREDSVSADPMVEVDRFVVLGLVHEELAKRPRQLVQVVSGLVIDPATKRVFMAKRPIESRRGGQWEFPGGKVEAGESHVEALVREWREEIGVTVLADPKRVARAAFSLEIDFEVSLYCCEIVEGTPAPLQSTQVDWIDWPHAVTYLPLVPSCYAFYPQIRHLFAAS